MPSVIGTDSQSGVNVAANYLKNVKANGLGPRTVIVKLDKAAMTNSELNFVLNYLTTAHGVGGSLPADTTDAFVVAGLSGDQTVDGKTLQFVSGTTGTVYVALQGTGTVTKAAIEANDNNAGFTATIVAEFDQNYQ